MPIVRFKCPSCGAPFEWRGLPPPSMACPNCKNTFQPHYIATTSTIDQLSAMGVAISGGGLRATLFGLGALLATVDLGLNGRVVQISSVSGGSLLNAFVALRCAFNEVRTESFDPLVRELATVIVKHGVLTKAWIRTIFLLPIVVFVLAVAIPPNVPVPGGLFLVIVIGLCLTAFLLRGWVVEWLLHRRLLGESRGWARISDIPERAVDHVLCCTELSSGKPCYISTWNRGRLYLRTKDARAWAARWGEWFEVPKLLLTSAVRASAAFPGIPPRRLVVHREGRPATTAFGGRLPVAAKPALRRALYLSDGGVWGNLGTQALLEEQLFRGECKGAKASERPAILLVVNASSGVEAVPSWQFALPGWAEFKALLRVVLIQNENTVEPRLTSILDDLRRHVVEDEPGRPDNPKVIPISLSEKPSDLFPIVGHGLWRRRGSGSALVAWALSLGDKVSDALWRGGDAELALPAQLREIDAQRPQDSNDPDSLLRRREDLETTTGWVRLCNLAQEAGPVATTLDRIPKPTAKALIAHGYAHAVAALYIFGVTGDKLPEHILTQQRLDALVT